jgi:hypothetical protein
MQGSNGGRVHRIAAGGGAGRSRARAEHHSQAVPGGGGNDLAQARGLAAVKDEIAAYEVNKSCNPFPSQGIQCFLWVVSPVPGAGENSVQSGSIAQ